MAGSHQQELGRSRNTTSRPGTRFQTYVLQNFYYPVVRPLVAASAFHVLWISQTNGDSPSSSEFVARGLDFHFCASPETFHVQSDSPSIYSTSVAANVVKLLLIRIGVFAIDGIIFRIHHDRRAAVLDVNPSATIKTAGRISNFESPRLKLAHQRTDCQTSHLPAHISGVQLEATTSEPTC